MDAMARREAEFGTMSVSAPILSDPNDVFKFDPHQDAADFYNDAKNSVQGSAARFEQSVSSFGLGANVSLEPSVALAYAAQLQQYQSVLAKNNAAQRLNDQNQAMINSAAQDLFNQQIADAKKIADPTQQQAAIDAAIKNFQSQSVAPTPTTLPSFPTSATPTSAANNLIGPPTQQTAQFANANGTDKVFAAFQQLSGHPSSLSVDDRAAIIKAAGDTAVNAMFRLLGDPKLSQSFRHKRVLFGVSTVSVSPGWRTRKNYAANITMSVGYDWGPARATLVESFIHNPKIPAPLRLRLALDQSLSLPLDPAARAVMKAAGIAVASPQGDEPPTAPLTNDEVKRLNRAVTRAGLQIPLAYRWEDSLNNSTVLAAAVSPMTDVQTLDLQDSVRRERELAINIALALQLTGANVAAQSFYNYANNLQQDFATKTPDVFANAFSTGGTFGFQIGPQLRAIEQIDRGQASGAGNVMERAAFPALIIFGFDSSDVVPRVRAMDGGKLMLVEPSVEFKSASRWLPVDHSEYSPMLRDSELMQLSYWLNHDLDSAKNSMPERTSALVDARLSGLRHAVFGDSYGFNLPEEVIMPTETPLVTNIEPKEIYLSPSAPVTVDMVLEGASLNAVNLERIKVVSGGEAVSKPRLLGGSISVKVKIEPAENPRPLVLALPSYYGAGTTTRAILPHSGSIAAITAIAPQLISLDADTFGVISPNNVQLVIAGHHLDLIDINGIVPTEPSGIVIRGRRLDGKTAIVLDLLVKAPVQSLSFLLPYANATLPALYTPPVTVTKNKITIRVNSEIAASGESRIKSTGQKADPKQQGQSSAAQQAAIQAAAAALVAQEKANELAARAVISQAAAAVAHAWATIVQSRYDAAAKALAADPHNATLVAALSDASQLNSNAQSMAAKLDAQATADQAAARAEYARAKAAQDASAAAAAKASASSASTSPVNTHSRTGATTRSSTIVEYSPGASDAVLSTVVGATTKPSSAEPAPGNKPTSPTTQSSGNSAAGSIINNVIAAQSSPTTSPSAP